VFSSDAMVNGEWRVGCRLSVTLGWCVYLYYVGGWW